MEFYSGFGGGDKMGKRQVRKSNFEFKKKNVNVNNNQIKTNVTN
jgi:hypothetical protein